MSDVNVNPNSDVGEIMPRASELVKEHQNRIVTLTSHLFSILMVVQWLAGMAAALWISPRAWAGATSSIHIHVWMAVFLGGASTSLPIFLTLVRPSDVFTRHTVAVCQMLMSSLLIHLSGGRIETHFHVFGSLAFLAFCRDWRVLVPATIVVAADHALARDLFSAIGVRNPHTQSLALGGARVLGHVRGRDPGQDVPARNPGDVGNSEAAGVDRGDYPWVGGEST